MNNLGNAFTRFVGKTKLFTIKNAPELLLAGGFITGAAALYFVAKNTISAKEVIERHKSDIAEIHEAIEVADEGEFPPEAVRVNIARTYGKTAWELFKVYAPTIIFVTLSVSCFLASHGLLKRRNVILATTLAGVRGAFEEYRGRVRNDLGDEMEEHFMYGTEVRTIEHEEVTDEGKTKKVKEKVNIATNASLYSRFFDEANDDYTKEPGANYIHVRNVMFDMQRRLVRDGHLFLNDVYKALRLPITVAGQSAGWVYDYDNRDKTLIFFKGFDINGNEENLSDSVRAFKNGYERNCLIDFANIRDDILTDLPRHDSKVAPV